MKKICTDIEQSNKLIELGIDMNSADMFWDTLFAKKPEAQVNNHHLVDEYDDEHRISAWSLSALLELMPLINHDTVNVFKEEDGTYTALYRYTKGSPVIIKKESAIDAAFEMIVWLKENGKI